MPCVEYLQDFRYEGRYGAHRAPVSCCRCKRCSPGDFQHRHEPEQSLAGSDIWPLVGGDRRDLSDPRRAGAQTARVFAAARHIHGLRGNGHFEAL